MFITKEASFDKLRMSGFGGHPSFGEDWNPRKPRSAVVE
jgi:hypothetical protein